MMRAKWLLTAIVGLLVGGVAPAEADFITYSFVGVGSGTLGSSAFSDRLFDIVVTADTNTITPFSFIRNGTLNTGYSITPAPAFIILGGSMASFLSPEKVFVNNTTSIVGFQSPNNADLLDLRAPAFATYDLASSNEHINGRIPTTLGAFRDVPTTLGTLTFTSYQPNVSFQATLTAVPEPSSLAMMGVGLVGMLSAARRPARQRVGA